MGKCTHSNRLYFLVLLRRGKRTVKNKILLILFFDWMPKKSKRGKGLAALPSTE
jgi:hypothetical protein